MNINQKALLEYYFSRSEEEKEFEADIQEIIAESQRDIADSMDEEILFAS